MFIFWTLMSLHYLDSLETLESPGSLFSAMGAYLQASICHCLLLMNHVSGMITF